jgi:probable HAF family extracellular repeat protein
MEGLGDLPGGEYLSLALAVSADGSTIVGHGETDAGTEAFRWIDGEMEGLGDLPGGDFYSKALDVSGDGSLIVGLGADAGWWNPRATIWDDEHGMRLLQDVLVTEYGLGLPGWTLERAEGISDDSLTIVGRGVNPAGYDEAWVVRIPEPATCALLALGSLLASRRRR